MRKSKKYTVPYKRKRESKTDYKFRRRILSSKKPRLVIRRSLNNLNAQIIEFQTKGDNVLISCNTRELRRFGWKSHLGNIPSAYLLGLLTASKAKNKKINDLVFDIGLQPSIKSSTLYSFLKGALDNGLNVPHTKEVLPKEDRISGKHISDYASKLKRDEVLYNKQFSGYLKQNLNPEDLQKHFEEVKDKILKENGGRES